MPRPFPAEFRLRVVEWIDGSYNPRRRRTSLGNLSPADFEARRTTAKIATWSALRNRPGNRVRLPTIAS